MSARLATVLDLLERWRREDERWSPDPMESRGGSLYDEGAHHGRRKRAGELAVALGEQRCYCEGYLTVGSYCRSCSRQGTKPVTGETL